MFRHQLYVQRGRPLVDRVGELSRFFLDGAGART
jgi:hypothetical protein